MQSSIRQNRSYLRSVKTRNSYTEKTRNIKEASSPLKTKVGRNRIMFMKESRDENHKRNVFLALLLMISLLVSFLLIIL